MRPTTNLAYIDEHVDRMLEAEVQSPTPHAAEIDRASKPRIIAGFKVQDEKLAQSILEEGRQMRRQVVEKYRAKKSEILELCSDAGIKPLAVLPTTMFSLMCKQSGLYSVPKYLRTEVNPTHFLTWLAAGEGQPVDSSIWTGIKARTSGQLRRGRGKDKTPESYLEEFGRETVMKHLLNLEDTSFETEGQEFKRRMDELRSNPAYSLADLRRVSTQPTNTRLRLRGRPQASPVDGRKYDIVLPIPPREVCDTLIKAADANLDLKTVCVPGAVDFADGGVIKVLHTAKRDREERDERIQKQIDWMLHDPIVYIERGPVTAIIAQFGPFPVEKEIIDRITAAEFLPQA